MRFKDKVVLVTGGSRGIGRDICLCFAREGAKVGINHSGRNAKPAEEVLAQIGKDNGLVLAADVADRTAVHSMIDDLIERFGRIDILVNNAGVCPFTDMFEVSDEEYEFIMGINAKGIFLTSQKAARHMRDNGGGCIVNVTSISGLRFTDPKQLVYCSSKAAANMMTRGLAVNLAPCNIRVNGVLPGTIPTDINRDVLAEPGVADGIIEKTPLKSLGDCRDISSAVLFLASDEAKWITGALLVVDGGFIA